MNSSADGACFFVDRKLSCPHDVSGVELSGDGGGGGGGLIYKAGKQSSCCAGCRRIRVHRNARCYLVTQSVCVCDVRRARSSATQGYACGPKQPLTSGRRVEATNSDLPL